MAASDPLQTLENNWFRVRDAYSVGAGAPANTGAAGARLRVEFFAGAPAPTKIAVRLTGSNGSKAAVRKGQQNAKTVQRLA
ncbi:hypothetical protein [Pseudomonas sp. AFG_SD02_1510_Pfu_092]|uniref:hypothetical protein n=1 Tax=Pseudomonas sp. AFG_SD02_1510_Pfu_092 TaxID=2259497 RepID=UPI0015AA3C79|nr:hypothetical protein [Pseudomonas sp. AFG_SD02_1510_Pfu_092]